MVRSCCPAWERGQGALARPPKIKLHFAYVSVISSTAPFLTFLAVSHLLARHNLEGMWEEKGGGMKGALWNFYSTSYCRYPSIKNYIQSENVTLPQKFRKCNICRWISEGFILCACIRVIYFLFTVCLHISHEKRAKNYTVTFWDILHLSILCWRMLSVTGISSLLHRYDCQHCGINTNFWTSEEKFLNCGTYPAIRRHPTFLTCLLLKIK